LGLPYAPARALIEGGVRVALGTDFNPGSCMSECLPLMTTLACTQMKMSPAEALLAVTREAALALGRGDRLGRLAPGMQADLLILDIPNYLHLPYHFGLNHVASVIKEGATVFER
ncbi:MAG: amidohydrolase family protein, partial [Nitrospinota bacterium]